MFINDLQAILYKELSENINIAIYDEVSETAVFPFVVIGDYMLNQADYKMTGYVFEWKIDIYTKYEGKKEVNILVGKVLEVLESLRYKNISENYVIDETSIIEVSVVRNEGFYVANINSKIELEEE